MVSSGNVNRHGVVSRIITASVENKFLTVLFVGMLALWGWMSLRRAPLDAIPDLSDTQVILLTEWPGRSPDRHHWRPAGGRL